jgi:hypothetical protein
MDAEFPAFGVAGYDDLGGSGEESVAEKLVTEARAKDFDTGVRGV